MKETAVTKIILVRHGQTAWNDGARFQGHLDSALTAAGVAQAESLGKRLAAEQIAAVYSSDLGRAVHTAEIIAAQARHRVQTDARLRERGLGVFEGLSNAEIQGRYPEESSRYYSRDADYIVPGGESARGRFALAFACLNDLVARHEGQIVVVVTHGGVVQGMFRHITGVAFDAPRRFAIRNTAYNVFAHGQQGWSLETWGDIAHFPADFKGPVVAPVENSHFDPLTP